MQMKQYVALVKRCLEEGVEVIDRTGVGTLSIFGHQSVYDLQSEGFPLLQLKKLHVKSIIHELLWFLKGDTNIKYLNDNNVHIWDEWADENGDLGHIYGYQWRSWPYYSFKDQTVKYYDQISEIIKELKSNPNSRRLIVNSWNVGDIDNMNLPPCNMMFQFYVADGKLSLQVYQRSADMVVGGPFNIASYSLFVLMMAQVTGLKPGEFIHTLGDAHIYLNHIDQVKLQLTREPKKLPNMILNKEIKNIF